MLEIREERFSEYRETENVVRDAFWNVYSPGCDDHYLVHQIRKSPAFIPELPFVTISSQNVSNICIFVLFCEPLCPIRLHLSILKWVSSVRENGSSHRELCGKEKE